MDSYAVHCARPAKPSYIIEPHRRHWALLDGVGQLICLTVYKKGAEEVVRRLVQTVGEGDGLNQPHVPAPSASALHSGPWRLI
jgi:hypothetical protein